MGLKLGSMFKILRRPSDTYDKIKDAKIIAENINKLANIIRLKLEGQAIKRQYQRFGHDVKSSLVDMLYNNNSNVEEEVNDDGEGSVV